MGRNIIITDSNADLPNELISGNIRVLPLRVLLEDKEAYSVDVISKEKFRRLLDMEVDSKVLAPTYEDTLDVFASIPKDISGVIILLSSSAINPYTEIMLEDALGVFSASHIHTSVVTLDSKLTSMALGLLVSDISKMIDDGYLFNNLLHYIKINKNKYALDFIASNKNMLIKNKIISTKKCEKIKEQNKEYIFELSTNGLFKIKDKVNCESNPDITMLNDALKICDGPIAIVSSNEEERLETVTTALLRKHKKDNYISEISSSNATIMGTKTLAICYRKK